MFIRIGEGGEDALPIQLPMLGKTYKVFNFKLTEGILQQILDKPSSTSLAINFSKTSGVTYCAHNLNDHLIFWICTQSLTLTKLLPFSFTFLPPFVTFGHTHKQTLSVDNENFKVKKDVEKVVSEVYKKEGDGKGTLVNLGCITHKLQVTAKPTGAKKEERKIQSMDTETALGNMHVRGQQIIFL